MVEEIADDMDASPIANRITQRLRASHVVAGDEALRLAKHAPISAQSWAQVIGYVLESGGPVFFEFARHLDARAELHKTSVGCRPADDIGCAMGNRHAGGAIQSQLAENVEGQRFPTIQHQPPLLHPIVNLDRGPLSMVRNVVSPEEGAELKRLYEEHAGASQRTAAILRTHGMESPEFAEADKAVGVVWRRIREILGQAGDHWMA